MTEPGQAEFPTSDLPPEPHIKDEAARMIDEVLLTLKLERAVIVVKSNSGWTVASAHEIPTEDFWTLAPLSLSVLESAAATGETVHLIDAGSSDKFGNRDSVILTGIRSVACAPYRGSDGEVKALLYADNRLEKGAFKDEDVTVLEELAQEMGRRLFEKG